MIKMKPIKPARQGFEKELAKVGEDTRKAYERQVNQSLAEKDIPCPAHRQRPMVKIVTSINMRNFPDELEYKVTGPCCQKLVNEVRGFLGDSIPVIKKG